ncbi:rCG56787, partial [Rattus norvegicus]
MCATGVCTEVLKDFHWAGEMAQWLRATTAPEFKSQQTHGASQTSVMRSDSLLWCLKTGT